LTPPLAHPTQRVYAHPDVAPADAAEFQWLFDRTQQLRDTTAARTHKSIHCKGNCRGTVLELKTSSGDGAKRIYFTMLAGAVVVLAFHAKTKQKKDIGLACGRCDDVHRNPSAFLNDDQLLHE
jgi:phage-related protein